MLRRLLACTAGVALSSCTPSADNGKAAGNTLVRLADDEVKSIDPQKASDLTSLRVAADQFEGLTRYTARGTIEAGLAEDWRADPSGRIWRFHLKPGLRFSDRHPIDAETFVHVFGRLRDGATGSPNASLFNVIDRVKAFSPRDLQITLRQPFPGLPELLAHPAIAALPMHRIDRAGERWTQERPLITSGAYRLLEWKLHDRIILVRNPMWHDGAAPIPQVQWKPADDRQSAFRQFRAGAADLTGDFPSERRDWLARHLPGAAQVAPYRGAYYFVFNTRRPPFDNADVRRALSMTVEREAIARKLLAIGNPPAWGVVPPGVDPAGAPYRPEWAAWSRARRVAAAMQLLHRAGYTTQRPLRFEIRFNSDLDHRRVVLGMIDNWRPLPVRASLLNSEATLHFASLRRGDFDLARSGWIGDLSAPENFLAVHAGNAGAINYSGYRSARFDRSLGEALATADPALRAARLRRAEALLMADSPILPIHYYVTKNLVGQRVEGWHNNLANIHPSRTLRLRSQ